MADGRHIEIHFLGYNSAPYCPIKTKFGVQRHNRTHTKARWWKCQISKIQDGGRPPFWKSLYLHISAATWPNFTKLCMRTQSLSQARKRDKKSQISKFKMADGRHIENHFLVITRLHCIQLRRNLEVGGIIARTRKLGDENVQFRKSNMADCRHFENHYILISQPQIVQIARNLVCRYKFYSRRQKRQNIRNSQIQNVGWTRH